MHNAYHTKPFRIAFISPSLNLFGRSQNSLRAQLGTRAHLMPFDTVAEALVAVRDPTLGIELVVLDSASVTSLKCLPQFLAAGDCGLPVLMLLRKGETEVAEAALEAGYKAILFVENEIQYRQLFPGMVLRIIAHFRGEQGKDPEERPKVPLARPLAFGALA